jgi:DNA-binding transcriptional LysR family regulator
MATTVETPDIRLLRSFLAVARDRSISGAARRLFVSQQTLSEQIRQLEKTVGVPLLIRGPRGVSLTAAGERLATGAALVAADLEALVDEVRRTA